MENINTEQGKLIVNVRTASGALPVQDARITVYSASDNGTPVSSVTSDRSGLSPLLTLPAPPRMLTMQPGADVKPYAEYTVVTSADGYYTVTNTNLPVYSGVTSIQPVELIPIADTRGKPYTPISDTEFNESRPPEL